MNVPRLPPPPFSSSPFVEHVFPPLHNELVRPSYKVEAVDAVELTGDAVPEEVTGTTGGNLPCLR